MISHTTFLRVRYAETDRMGYVYYGNYATYFEVARVETLRACGVSYKSLEDIGILLPVINFNVRYFAPSTTNGSTEISISMSPQRNTLERS
jgi:acyl-CoA thioester hydrolase